MKSITHTFLALTIWGLSAMGVCAQTGQAKLKEGDPAPAFEEAFTGGELTSLDRFRGRWLALYFFIKAETQAGETQAVALRESHDKLRSMKANVLGVSRDDLDTLKAFKTKHELPFDLVSDTNKTMAVAYGVIGFGGMNQRRTFIINPRGELAAVLYGVTINKHGEEIVDMLRKLQDEAND